jgi:ABC-type transport system involved in cytochrome c biogenesis permease subunit
MHFLALFLQNQPDPEAIKSMVMAMMAIIPIIILVSLVIVIVPFWFICKKAGFSPWLSLLNVIPLGSLILLYVLAFSEWKVIPAPQPGWPPPPPFPPQPPYPPQA